MKVKLTKTNDEWRTLSADKQQQATVIGDAPFMPTVGKPFYVDCPNRNIKTSPIEELLPDGKFRTGNSIYKVEKL